MYIQICNNRFIDIVSYLETDNTKRQSIEDGGVGLPVLERKKIKITTSLQDFTQILILSQQLYIIGLLCC